MWVEGVAGTPGEGPYIVLKLLFEEGVCVDAETKCNGCQAALTASYGLSIVAKGRTAEQLSALDATALNILVGGLPEGKGQYLTLAIEALRGCLLQMASATGGAS